jgi:hypothetical protein
MYQTIDYVAAVLVAIMILGPLSAGQSHVPSNNSFLESLSHEATDNARYNSVRVGDHRKCYAGGHALRRGERNSEAYVLCQERRERRVRRLLV